MFAVNPGRVTSVVELELAKLTECVNCIGMCQLHWKKVIFSLSPIARHPIWDLFLDTVLWKTAVEDPAEDLSREGSATQDERTRRVV